MSDKIDRLFLERGCPMCGIVRAELDAERVSRPEYVGPDGQKVFVFGTLSEAASKDILSRFDLNGKVPPILVTHEGEVRTDLKRILAYLKSKQMTVG